MASVLSQLASELGVSEDAVRALFGTKSRPLASKMVSITDERNKREREYQEQLAELADALAIAKAEEDAALGQA